MTFPDGDEEGDEGLLFSMAKASCCCADWEIISENRLGHIGIVYDIIAESRFDSR